MILLDITEEYKLLVIFTAEDRIDQSLRAEIADGVSIYRLGSHISGCFVPGSSGEIGDVKGNR